MVLGFLVNSDFSDRQLPSCTRHRPHLSERRIYYPIRPTGPDLKGAKKAQLPKPEQFDKGLQRRQISKLSPLRCRQYIGQPSLLWIGSRVCSRTFKLQKAKPINVHPDYCGRIQFYAFSCRKCCFQKVFKPWTLQSSPN